MAAINLVPTLLFTGLRTPHSYMYIEKYTRTCFVSFIYTSSKINVKSRVLIKSGEQKMKGEKQLNKKKSERKKKEKER